MKVKHINISEVMANVNLDVRIKGIKIARIRMFIGTSLIKFGVWVIGCKTEIKVNEA